MEPIKAGVFFQQNKDSVTLYLFAAEAIPVDDGYTVCGEFYDTDTFVESFDQAPEIVDFTLPNLPADSDLQQVRLGDMTVIYGDSCPAPADGFILTLLGDEAKYYPDGVFRSMYQVIAPPRTDGGFLVIENEATFFDGIALTEDTIFDFKEGTRMAKAGSLLYENPEDVDGYSTCPVSSSLAKFLKLRLAIYPKDNITCYARPGWDCRVQ